MKRKKIPAFLKYQEAQFHCEGLEARVMLSSVQLLAAGVEGTEQMQLSIDGTAVETWTLGTGAYEGIYQTYQYESAETLSADQIRVEFLNDNYDPTNGIDANLRLDAIVIDGERFETEAPSVYSTGTWLPVDGLVAGYRESEFLHTNGYFQFADTSMPTYAAPLNVGSVIINEVHYNPGPDGVVDGDAEFIELYNTTDTDIDLSGASFSGFTLVFAEGTTIGAGQYVIVGPSIALAESTWGVTPIAEFASGGISGSGELIQLIAADGTTVIDEVDYLDQAPWPAAPDGNGPSLELRDPTLDNSLASSWGASIGAPTPGAQNSIFGTAVESPISAIVAPTQVLPGEAFDISATITGATSATLVYKLGINGAEQSIVMTNVGDVWTATLPGQEAGELVRYRIESDVAVAPFNDTINYFGLFISPTDIVDNTLPVFQFWVDDVLFEELTQTELALTDAKLPVVIAYGNTVIDNATVEVRGGDYSRTNYPKKSLKFELPSGYTIDIGAEGSYPLDEFAIQADFGDWSQVTPDISWDLFNAETTSFESSFFTRVENNGDFYGVFRFQELYDGGWRDANGFNGDDELYKAGEGGFGEFPGFDKKDPDDGDYTSINALNEVLIAPPSAAKTAYLYRNVDIANVINHTALSVLMRHDDQDVQNFYMWLDADTGIWSVVEWDVDRTWVASDPEFGDFTTPELIGAQLMDSIWEVPEFREMYWRRMQTLVDKYLSDDQLIQRHAELIEQIGATNSALEFAKWGRNDIYANRFWEQEFADAIEQRRIAFANETRMPGTASGNYNIVINELHYNPLDGDAEFIELYNNSDESVDLSGWQIDGVGLTIGYGTVLLPRQSVVFTDDWVQFKTQYSGDIFVGGQYSGGLSGSGELITLLDATGNEIDAVEYDDAGDWPTEPDGNGYTLALIDPNLDNSLASSWVASTQINGTPGLLNDQDQSGSTLILFASGNTGNEIIELQIGGQIVASYLLSDYGVQAGDLDLRKFAVIEFAAATPINIGDVRINFINDIYDPTNGIDYNVSIDRVVVDGTSYQTEAPDVYSTGTWKPEDGVVPGFRESEVLHTNGYFQYAATSPANQSPIAIADTATTNEGESVSISVLGNDNDPDAGDVISIQSVTQAGNGLVTVSGNSVVYTPNAGFVGVDTFTYTISDNAGELSAATVEVTVLSTNAAPTAIADSATTTSGQAVTVNVLANDSDPDAGDSISISAVTQGSHGTVSISGSSVVYTPDTGYVGADQFNYTVVDQAGAASTATVSVTVTAPPTVIANGSIVQLRNLQFNSWLRSSSTAAQTTTTNDARTQWRLISAGSNGYYLQNIGSGRYLDGDRFSVDTTSNRGATGTVWQFAAASNGGYYLYNVAYGRYLDANGTNTGVAWDIGGLESDDIWLVTLV